MLKINVHNVYIGILTTKYKRKTCCMYMLIEERHCS